MYHVPAMQRHMFSLDMQKRGPEDHVEWLIQQKKDYEVYLVSYDLIDCNVSVM
jgi:hypothetical protein